MDAAIAQVLNQNVLDIRCTRADRSAGKRSPRSRKSSSGRKGSGGGGGAGQTHEYLVGTLARELTHFRCVRGVLFVMKNGAWDSALVYFEERLKKERDLSSRKSARP